MSNAIAQTSNTVALSTCSVDQFDFAAAVRKYATRSDKIKGNTKDVRSLKRNKLISGVCAVFRDHYPSLFAKRDDKGNIIDQTQRVPAEYHEKIVLAVDEFITKSLAEFCQDTLEFTRRHVHKAKRHIFVEVRTAKDEQEINWKDQHCACVIAIGAVNRRIQDLDKGNRLTDDNYLKLVEQRKALETTLENIEAHLPADELNKLKSL